MFDPCKGLSSKLPSSGGSSVPAHKRSPQQGLLTISLPSPRRGQGKVTEPSPEYPTASPFCQTLVCNSAWITVDILGGDRESEGRTRGRTPSTLPQGSHHPCPVQPFQSGALRSPVLLLVTPHLLLCMKASSTPLPLNSRKSYLRFSLVL